MSPSWYPIISHHHIPLYSICFPRIDRWIPIFYDINSQFPMAPMAPSPGLLTCELVAAKFTKSTIMTSARELSWSPGSVAMTQEPIDWRYQSHIFLAYDQWPKFQGISLEFIWPKIWYVLVLRYLHFRILKFPLILTGWLRLVAWFIPSVLSHWWWIRYQKHWPLPWNPIKCQEIISKSQQRCL